MGEKEIREKYGGKLAKAMNRAIRAEIEGGNEALDRLAKLSGPAAHSGWTHPDGSPTEAAQLYHKHKKSIVDPMERQIRQKWGLGAAVSEPKKEKRKSSAKPKRPFRKKK